MTTEREKYTVTTKLGEVIRVDAFVVPNSLASSLTALIEPERFSKFIEDLNKINGTQWAPKYWLWQSWLVGTETVGSENLVDHGFRLIDPETNEILRCNMATSGFLPLEPFLGKKEGDKVIIKLPINIHKRNDDDDIDIEKMAATFEITLNQLGFRYRRFGRFEEVIDKLRWHNSEDIKVSDAAVNSLK